MSLHPLSPMPRESKGFDTVAAVVIEEPSVAEDYGTVPTGSIEPLQIYMQEVGQHPLLTKEQEVELATAMRDGEEAAARLEETEDPDERDALEQLIVDGKLAQEQLANCNLRLVVSLAKRYLNSGLGFLDLIQEGNVGLMRAVEKFDHTRGFKFSTYATWWIRQAISRALADQSRTIRLPVHVVGTIKKLHRLTKQLSIEKGREPSHLELSLAMGFLEEEYSGMVPDYVIEEDAYQLVVDEEVSQRLEDAVDKIKKLRNLDANPISLYSAIQHEDDSYFLDLVEDVDSPEPAELASRNIMKEEVENVVWELEERERDVLYYRYGLQDTAPQTLDSLGKHFKITRERIRQIEIEALRKIGEEDGERRLRDFLV